MKEKWEELLVILNQILDVYQIILMLSEQKKEIMVATKIEELEKVTKREELIIPQIRKLENQRGKIISELMADHGITEGRVSLKELYKVATPDIIEQLEVFSKKITIIMEKIVPLNKLNTQLIQQALGFIDYNINLLSQTVADTTYAAKGQAGVQSKRIVFDARV